MSTVFPTFTEDELFSIEEIGSRWNCEASEVLRRIEDKVPVYARMFAVCGQEFECEQVDWEIWFREDEGMPRFSFDQAFCQLRPDYIRRIRFEGAASFAPLEQVYKGLDERYPDGMWGVRFSRHDGRGINLTNKELCVPVVEIEKFERENGYPEKQLQNGGRAKRETTLLKAFGAVVIANYSRDKYRNGEKYNASAIVDEIEKCLVVLGYSCEGIKNRNMRDIVKEAMALIEENRKD